MKARYVRLVILLTAASISAAVAPPDVGRLAAFREAYNTYVRSLSQGIQDLKQWERVERAWERLTGRKCQ